MVIHTDTVALLDPQGKMRYIYNQDRLDDLEQDLNYLLAQRTW
jgi:cytochrome oxidase Cu insertion factor (SCO1/SenC/PrrC family)